MKLQEAPENIPTGEMPRSVLISVDRYLADTLTPGTRVKIMGIFNITNKQGQNSNSGQGAKGMKGNV